MAVIDKLRAAVGFPRRAWDRRTHRWGDYLEWVRWLIAAVFIFLAFQSIQNSREDTIRRSCKESNVRHDRTIRQIDVLYLKRLNMLPPPPGVAAAVVKRELDQALDSATPAQREQISNARAATITIIDQLSPKRQCDKRARELTK